MSYKKAIQRMIQLAKSEAAKKEKVIARTNSLFYRMDYFNNEVKSWPELERCNVCSVTLKYNGVHLDDSWLCIGCHVKLRKTINNDGFNSYCYACMGFDPEW